MWSVRGTNIHRFQAFHHLDWHKVSNSLNFCPSWCSTFIDQLLHLFEIVNQTRNAVSSCSILYHMYSSLQRLWYWCCLPLISLLPSSCQPQILIRAYVLFMPVKEAETVSTYLWSFLRAHWPGMASWIWGQLRRTTNDGIVDDLRRFVCEMIVGASGCRKSPTASKDLNTCAPHHHFCLRNGLIRKNSS